MMLQRENGLRWGQQWVGYYDVLFYAPRTIFPHFYAIAQRTTKAAIAKYGHLGLFKKEYFHLRCNCKNTPLEGRSEWDISRHLKGKAHVKLLEKRERLAQDQARLSELMDKQKGEETARLELVGTRASNLTETDKEFCKDTVKEFLRSGIPLNKLDGTLRGYLTKNTHKALSHRSELASTYIPKLRENEKELQRLECRDRNVLVSYNATPRRGDLFAVVARYIESNEEKRTAKAVHILIHVSAMRGSMDANSLSEELSRALANRQIMPENVPAAAMDRCSTNSCSANEMNEAAAAAGNVERLAIYCLSHMICNAGDQASFVLLELFWYYLQKIFLQSTQAQAEWFDVTGTHWPTYSETR